MCARESESHRQSEIWKMCCCGSSQLCDLTHTHAPLWLILMVSRPHTYKCATICTCVSLYVILVTAGAAQLEGGKGETDIFSFRTPLKVHLKLQQHSKNSNSVDVDIFTYFSFLGQYFLSFHCSQCEKKLVYFELMWFEQILWEWKFFVNQSINQ